MNNAGKESCKNASPLDSDRPHQQINYLIQTMIRRARQISAPLITLIDIDNVLVKTSDARLRLLNQFATSMRGKPDAELPSLKTIAQRGLIEAYKPVFAEETETILNRVREKYPTYKRATPVAYNIDSQLKSVQEFANVIGYLSARFYNPRIFDLTAQQLFKDMHLPKRPMILRPPNVSITEAEVLMKMDTLTKIARKTPNKRLVIIDDNLDLARAIKTYNQAQKYRSIIDILFQIEDRQTPEGLINAGLGIYEANWITIPDTLRNIQQ